MFNLLQKLKDFFPKAIPASFSLGILGSFLTVLPGKAAEEIYMVYGPLKLSLQVDSLETFAREGKVNQELEFYLGFAGLKPEQYPQVQQLLLKRYNVNPVRLSRFLNTPTGEQILERIGVLISLPGGSNGKYVLRGAMVQAALDQEQGLTVINFLNYLATDVQLNIPAILQTLDYLQRLLKATNGIVQDTASLSSQAASAIAIDYSQLPELREAGTYGVKPLEVIQLRDPKRDRQFYLHLYQPQRWRSGKTPVVVVSHGLTSRPEDFAELGQHLASHGYLVAIPQHPGSDYQQLQAMLEGYTEDVYELQEFIDRPLDVSYVLDELERLNQSRWQGKLNLERVGVLGHSFGGYTALALAGATLEQKNVKLYCDRQIWEANLSMLMQCQTLNLPERNYNFRDPRVQAVGMMNPVNSVVFGPEGLGKVEIPVIIGAGTDDPATPALIEQVRTLVWLNSRHKYLLLMVGQAHFLSLPELDSQVSSLLGAIANLDTDQVDLLRLYAQTKATAFLEVYIADNPDYQVYLQPGYWQYISNSTNPVYFVDHLAVFTLSNTYNRFKPEAIPALIPHEVPRPQQQ